MGSKIRIPMRLSQLEKDLKAVEIKEVEKSEMDTHPYVTSGRQVEVTWTDREEVPDSHKRVAAVLNMGMIYQSVRDFNNYLEVFGALENATKNDCFNASTSAREVLENNPSVILRFLPDLREGLRATTVVPGGGGGDISNRSWGDRDSGGYASWGESSGEAPYEIPNTEARVKCAKTVSKIYKATKERGIFRLIESEYSENDSKEVRKILGKALGKNRVKIWFDNLLR